MAKSKKPKKNEKNQAAKAKKPSQGASKPRKTKNQKKQEVIEPDASVKDQVTSVLHECKKSHCTHPSFEWFEPSMPVELCVYWTRKAVGIKAERHALKNKKAQGTGKAQILYFSGRTPCVYTNIAIGELWVPRL